MIDLPQFIGNVSSAEVVLGCGLFTIGYLAHESMHAIAFAVMGVDGEASILPRSDGEALWETLLLGDIVSIAITEPVVRWKAVVAALAPMVALLPGLYVWAVLLSLPAVDWGVAFAVLAYTLPTFPSPADLWVAATYQPEQVEAAAGGVA